MQLLNLKPLGSVGKRLQTAPDVAALHRVLPVQRHSLVPTSSSVLRSLPTVSRSVLQATAAAAPAVEAARCLTMPGQGVAQVWSAPQSHV
jgi:hypothetical protein